MRITITTVGVIFLSELKVDFIKQIWIPF